MTAIVLKCLEKNPTHRYASATALADDLEAWLAGQPIQARPPGPVRRLVRWMRRRALALGTSAALAMTGVTLAVWQPWVDPDAALHRMEAALEEGQPVTWLDDHAPLPWSEALTSVTLAPSDDGAFRFSAKRWGLILLLHNPMVADYTFAADVRLDSYPKGQAGVFVCRTPHEAAEGKLDAMVLATVDAGFDQAQKTIAAQLALAYPRRRACNARGTPCPCTRPAEARARRTAGIA